MIRTGEVTQAEDGLLTVVFERPEACAHCGGCLHKSCTYVQLPGAARVGDRVDVELPGEKVVQASLLAYIVPLCGLLLGLFLGARARLAWSLPLSEDLCCALGGLLLCGLAFLAVRRVDRRLSRRKRWQPRIVAVHSAGEEV